jgi:uncharacterized protein
MLGLLPPLAILGIVGGLFAPGPWWIAALAAPAILASVVAWYPGARHRRWRWRLDTLALELRHGVIVRRAASIPYFRIQQIDVTRRPLERVMGLATLEVTTASAGGVATLPGLDAAEALEIRRELLARAAAVLAAHAGDARDAV